MDFGRENEAKLVSEIDEKTMSTSKSDFMKNNGFTSAKLTFFKVRGVQVGNKNRRKIDKKMRSRRECLLDFIFSRFWWILGAKLGPSWEGKSSQDSPRQAKTGQDKGSEGKGRERKRKGRDWKGKVWKSVAGDLLRSGGEGFARLLGGYLSLAPGRRGRAVS